MTGTDPAVDAARRAFDHWRSARPPKSAEVISETAAREALAPIRATLRALGEAIDALPNATRPAVFTLLVHAINDIEKHTFTSEELTNGNV